MQKHKKKCGRSSAKSSPRKVARTRVTIKVRDYKREDDIRVSFHNGMLAGLEEVRREVSDPKAASAIVKIQNRVLAHRDNRSHESSRWYKGNCRQAIYRADKLKR